MRTERAKVLDAIEEVPAGCVTTDVRGVVVQANSRASALLGVSRLVDRPLIGFVARRDTRAFRVMLKGLASQERSEARGDLRFRRRGGPVFVASLRGQVLYGLDRQPVALQWLVEPASP
jgi:PAS domain S-box-containing protein